MRVDEGAGSVAGGSEAPAVPWWWWLSPIGAITGAADIAAGFIAGPSYSGLYEHLGFQGPTVGGVVTDIATSPIVTAVLGVLRDLFIMALPWIIMILGVVIVLFLLYKKGLPWLLEKIERRF